MSFAQKIVKWTLAVLLGCVFMLVGAMKISNAIHPETSKFMAQSFPHYAKLWPASITGWNGDSLRAVVGTMEVVFGSLALCPHYTRLSAFVFITLMSGAVYSHAMLKEPFVLAAVLLALSVALFAVSGDAVTRAPSKKEAAKKAQ